MASAPATLPPAATELLARGLHTDPFAVLGPHDLDHEGRRGLVIRAFRPHAAEIAVRDVVGNRTIPMTRLHSEGVFELFVAGATRDTFDYRLRITFGDRSELETRYAELLAKYAANSIPRPDNWGGYRVTADRIEFWQGRTSRLHDRLLYVRDGKTWSRSRLAP